MFPAKRNHWVQNANLNQTIQSLMSFTNFLASYSHHNQALPLVHTTKSMIFEEKIIETNQLIPTACPCFNENLLYLFYGRPAYRVPCDTNKPMLPNVQPVCIILKPEASVSIKRVFPFDSGACHAGLYDMHLKWTNINNFDLGSDLDKALETISAFFYNNSNYIEGTVLSTVSIPSTEPEVVAYYDLITDMSYPATSPVTADDRRHSIEIQSDQIFSIKNSSVIPKKKTKSSAAGKKKHNKDGNVLAVVAPADFYRNVKLKKIITQDWKCELIPYYPASRHRPDEIHGIVWGLVTNFLDKNGYL